MSDGSGGSTIPIWVWAVGGGLGPGTVAAILTAVIKGWFSKKETAVDADARERAQLSTDQQSLVESYRSDLASERSENVRLRAEKRELERDRDRGWDLARAWNKCAHALWHVLNNAVQVIMMMFEPDGKPMPPNIVPPAALPGLEDIDKEPSK